MLHIKTVILNEMEDRGYDSYYMRHCLENNKHTYGTTAYFLLLED